MSSHECSGSGGTTTSFRGGEVSLEGGRGSERSNLANRLAL